MKAMTEVAKAVYLNILLDCWLKLGGKVEVGDGVDRTT